MPDFHIFRIPHSNFRIPIYLTPNLDLILWHF